MILPKSIEEVVERIQVEEVLGDFIDLRRAGSNLKGLCPFHNEKTPSFVVSPGKNIYKCFGCGKGGDAITFLMDLEKLSYPEAIRWLANKYQIELEETKASPEQIKEHQQKESLYIINQFAQEQFRNNLFHTDEGKSIGLSYFKSRDFSEDTIKAWELGYCVDNRTDLLDALQKNKYNLELATSIGLIKNDRDFFNSRVTFPIHNLSGKVIGFGARILSSNKKAPKYLNSPESEIYNKRKVLFGMHKAKAHIRKHDVCYLVEGYTDVIRLASGGIENIVSTSGTALTVDQIRLLKRFSQNVTIIYDGDKAGIMAALRGLNLVLEQDMNVRLVLLPEGEDPDSHFRKLGATAFTAYLEEHAKDFILFKTDLLLKETEHDPIKRSGVIKDIIESIAHIADPLKRSVYVKQCAGLLELSEDIIQQQANTFIKQLKSKSTPKYSTNKEPLQVIEPKEPTPKGETKIVQTNNPHETQERDLIRILFRFGDKSISSDTQEFVSIATFIIEQTDDIKEFFYNKLYVEILESLQEYLEQGKALSSKFWLQHSNPNYKKLAIDLMADKFQYADWKSRGIELQAQAPPEENFTRDAQSTILRLRYKKLQLGLDQIKEIILEVGKDNPEDLHDYLEAYKVRLAEIQEISKILRSVTF